MIKQMVQRVLGFLLMALLISTVNAETSPVPMLQKTAQEIIDTLKVNQGHLKTDNRIINQAIQRYLLPHVDIEGMSRSVLGGQVWTKATASEKQAFSHVFTELIIRTYASPLAEYSGETVNFMPVRGEIDAHFLRVNSVISRPNGQRIPLSYNLVSKSGDWKIYDLSVEGISLLQSFKLQFANILQQGTIKDLINQMRANKRAA